MDLRGFILGMVYIWYSQAIKMNTIYSQTLGQLTQDENFEDWWHSQPFEIPLFDGKTMPVIFMDFVPEHDAEFTSEADEAVRNFFKLDSVYRENISAHVYKNCIDFLAAVEYDKADDHLRNIENEEEIWQYVHPNEIYVSRRHRRDGNIYIMIACDCDWEQEHGLQLVFRQGKKLTRVSEQDGHVTEADAYDKPDSEDELLSKF